MSTYHLKHLNRSAYISSIATIKDDKSIKFANMALAWWDRYFNWDSHGCVILSNEKREHLCYIFYKIDRYAKYLTIHNIFTPLEYRRHGYAHTLTKLVFEGAIENRVSRFRATCIPNSLDFYLSMGFVYWGVNSVGDYYCNLPLPAEGLEGIASMIKHTSTENLADGYLNDILIKVKGNAAKLNDVQTLTYLSNVAKLDTSYLYEELMLLEVKKNG